MSNDMSASFHAKLDADALLAILAEAQDTIRNYDTKAEISGVGFILAVGIVKQAGDSIIVPIEFAMFYVLAGWLVIVIPIIMLALVLYPARFNKTVTSVQPDDVQIVMYFDRRVFLNVDAYIKATNESDWAKEIVFEIMEVSGIRDIKRQRFLRALYWSAGSFTFLFLSQMMRASGALN